MEIAQDHVVRFHYRLHNSEGEAVEHSHDGDPLTYLHGHGGIIPGLEAAMSGRGRSWLERVARGCCEASGPGRFRDGGSIP